MAIRLKFQDIAESIVQFILQSAQNTKNVCHFMYLLQEADRLESILGDILYSTQPVGQSSHIGIVYVRYFIILDMMRISISNWMKSF
jgi:hypothetical protein